MGVVFWFHLCYRPKTKSSGFNLPCDGSSSRVMLPRFFHGIPKGLRVPFRITISKIIFIGYRSIHDRNIFIFWSNR